MGLFLRTMPKIKSPFAKKKQAYDGWIKCTHCAEMVHASEIENNLHCCPKCNEHHKLSGKQRVELLADKGTFEEKFTQFQSKDPLEFVDTQKYADRLESAKKKSGRDEAILVGTCLINGRKAALGVMDFTFMAGSMGSVVGERLTCLIELAVKESLPLIIVSASGGARMQESSLSLMQMAKTSAALGLLADKGLPYLSVLTNPTTGGVTASFATLGDVIVAEPRALIAFAGPRVVEQAMGKKLPPGAQKAEFLLKHGMIDCIVPRQNLKKRLSEFLEFFSANSKDPLKDLLAAANKKSS